MPAIRFFGSVDPIKFLIPRKLGFHPVFRGDLLAMRSQESDLVFLCAKQIQAQCKEEHIDFLPFSLASMLHAVQYKELRVQLLLKSKQFLEKMSTCQLGSVVYINKQEISSIPFEAILRCRVSIKTPQCDCENMLFGVELKVSVEYVILYACWSWACCL